MSLEYLVRPESKEAIKDYEGQVKKTISQLRLHWPKRDNVSFTNNLNRFKPTK